MGILPGNPIVKAWLKVVWEPAGVAACVSMLLMLVSRSLGGLGVGVLLAACLWLAGWAGWRVARQGVGRAGSAMLAGAAVPAVVAGLLVVVGSLFAVATVVVAPGGTLELRAGLAQWLALAAVLAVAALSGLLGWRLAVRGQVRNAT